MLGKIVCSRAGSDKGSFSVIVKAEEKTVFICDGKRYPLARPKLKNRKHLAFTDKILKAEEFTTDKSLRKVLAVYRGNMK